MVACVRSASPHVHPGAPVGAGHGHRGPGPAEQARQRRRPHPPGQTAGRGQGAGREGADGGAQAVSLVALAGGADADTTRTDLGAAVALNRQASLASGLLVTVPPPPEDTQWEQQKDAHQSDATSPSMVAAVFDPATGDVTDAAHTPGLAAARVGITTHATGDAVENRLTIVPGDGGAGVSYPVDAATVHSASDSDTFNSQLYDLEQDRLFSSSLRQSGITALSTPGLEPRPTLRLPGRRIRDLLKPASAAASHSHLWVPSAPHGALAPHPQCGRGTDRAQTAQ